MSILRDIAEEVLPYGGFANYVREKEALWEMLKQGAEEKRKQEENKNKEEGLKNGIAQ